MKPEEKPRGIRNNNPGNIRHVDGIAWRGETPPDADGYCRFKSMDHGIVAAYKNLKTYHEKHGCMYLADYIGRWAPKSENDLEAYVHDIANRIGSAWGYFIYVPHELPRLLWAMFIHENGGEFISLAGVVNALLGDNTISTVDKIALKSMYGAESKRGK